MVGPVLELPQRAMAWALVELVAVLAEMVAAVAVTKEYAAGVESFIHEYQSDTQFSN